MAAQLYYSMSVLDYNLDSFWTKQPLVRKLMLSHPEVEWFWWMDSDAIFTGKMLQKIRMFRSDPCLSRCHTFEVERVLWMDLDAIFPNEYEAGMRWRKDGMGLAEALQEGASHSLHQEARK